MFYDGNGKASVLGYFSKCFRLTIDKHGDHQIGVAFSTNWGMDVYLCNINFGRGEWALLHDFFHATPFTSHGDTPHGAWRFYKAKDVGAYISFRGGVIIILHMSE